MNTNAAMGYDDMITANGIPTRREKRHHAQQGENAEMTREFTDIHADGELGYASLHTEIRHGETERAIGLIRDGADIHAKNGYGDTPLHTAAIRGRSAIALSLITAGADIHARGENGYTPLICAIENNHAETERALKDVAKSLPLTDKQRMYADFWGQLLEDMNDKHGTSARVFNKRSYVDAKTGLGPRFSPFGRTMRFTEDGKAQVVLNIDKPKSQAWNKIAFDLLAKDREGIESEVGGCAWVWYRLERANVCRIAISRDGTIEDSKESLDEIRRWMTEYFVKFPAIFRPRLERVLASM